MPEFLHKPKAQTRGEKRLARYAKNFGGPWAGYDHRAYVVSLPCVVSGGSAVDPSHVKRRSLGGTWEDLVPLNRLTHEVFDYDLGNDPERFKKLYGVDLAALALELAQEARRKNA